jgi:hypothetical protein
MSTRENLLFASAHVAFVRDVAPRVHESLDDLDAAYAEIYRDHPFQRAPDFMAALKRLIEQPGFQAILQPPDQD